MTVTDTLLPSSTLFRSTRALKPFAPADPAAHQTLRGAIDFPDMIASAPFDPCLLEPGRHRGRGVDDHRPAREVVTGACRRRERSEEHTSELQSLMRISYAVFCLKTITKRIQPVDI